MSRLSRKTAWGSYQHATTNHSTNLVFQEHSKKHTECRKSLLFKRKLHFRFKSTKIFRKLFFKNNVKKKVLLTVFK